MSEECYLYKSGLVAEPVVAILAHAVEVGLVLAVVAVRKLAILVEPERCTRITLISIIV